MARWRSSFLRPSSMIGAPSTAGVGRSRMFPFGTPAQRLHEVYDLGRFSIMRDFNLFASVLFTEQFFQRPLVVILEFFRIEMSGFGSGSSVAVPSRPHKLERGPLFFGFCVLLFGLALLFPDGKNLQMIACTTFPAWPHRAGGSD